MKLQTAGKPYRQPTNDGRTSLCRSLQNNGRKFIEANSQPRTATLIWRFEECGSAGRDDGASGQGLLAKEMKEARLKPPILPTVKEVVLANSTFEQAVYQKTLCHKGQPSLEQVVTNSDKRPIGSSGGFGYRSQVEDYDIALMDSILLAHWLCVDAKPVVKQKIRY